MIRAGLFTDPVSTPWPATDDGDVARRWLSPLMRDGVRRYVANASGTVAVVVVGDHALPVHLPDPGRPQTWTSLPSAQYVDYAREELRIARVPGAAPLGLALGALAITVRGVDRVAAVNSWLLSTNLYPRLSRGEVDAVLRVVREAFPDRAVLWRSVDDRVRSDLLAHATALGGAPVFSRLVWIFDPSDADAWAHRDLRRDLRLLDRATVRPAARADVPRILQLYRKLYLDRYSSLNPEITADLLDVLVGDALLDTQVVERDGRVDAVNGFFVRGGVLTSPLLGWDTDVAQRAGLYRIACALTVRIGLERGLLVHQSAGVGRFKRQRGALAATEYHVVFTGHLGPRARAAWTLLGAAGRAAAPIVARVDA